MSAPDAPGLSRALLCYGMTGLFHGTGMTEAIEQQTGQRIYVLPFGWPFARQGMQISLLCVGSTGVFGGA